MAPTIPRARTRTRLPKSARPPQTQPSSSLFALDRTSKRDKRTIKHSTLLSRIQKSHPSARKKRRRPSKKLVTTFEGLADALPEDGNEGREQRDQQIIQQRSLKSKPGRAKKREREIKEQKDRFERNLARMIEGNDVGGSDGSGDGNENAKSGRSWKALRAYIQQTVEKKGNDGM